MTLKIDLLIIQGHRNIKHKIIIVYKYFCNKLFKAKIFNQNYKSKYELK